MSTSGLSLIILYLVDFQTFEVGIALLLISSFSVWIPDALMLIRASPRNTVQGWRKLLLTSAVTISLVLCVFGLAAAVEMVFILQDYRSLSRSVYSKTFFEIVDGKCKVDNDGIHVKTIIHNDSDNVHAVRGIIAYVGFKRYYRYYLPSEAYLKPGDVKTISGSAPADATINGLISHKEHLRCRYSVPFAGPAGENQEELIDLRSADAP